MLHIHNILVATDFSDCSREGVELGIRLADKTGARLHVVFVQIFLADPFGPSVYPPEEPHTVTDALRDLVLRARKAVGIDELGGDEIAYGVLHDSAVTPAIERYARDYSVDLAIVGTHGRRGLRHMMMGSVAEELVRTLPCPVVTVRADPDRHDVQPETGREILVPVDFSAHSIEALHAGREFAALFQTGMRILHVVEETLHPAFYNAGAFSIYDLQPDVEERAWSHLEQLLSETPGPNVPVQLEVVDGRAAPEIVRVARERSALMIVMATHGLTGMAHLLMGSVAEKVVRSAPCPTLVVKSFGQSLFGTGHREKSSTAELAR